MRIQKRLSRPKGALHAMRVLASVFAAASAAVSLAPRASAGEGGPTDGVEIESLRPAIAAPTLGEAEAKSELALVMSDIDDRFQLVRAAAASPGQDTPERNARLAQAASEMADLFTRARALVPATAPTPPDAADYQSRIDSLIGLCRQLETAYRNNRPADAAVVARQMGSEASSGHRRYRPRQ